ncbi:hypothetical protein Trydic_g9055 [Trypoxylus dichotomus]
MWHRMSSVVGLEYSDTEYCAWVWPNSVHSRLVESNNTMRLIWSTIKSTPVDLFPVLSHIKPAEIRRQETLLREPRGMVCNP